MSSEDVLRLSRRGALGLAFSGVAIASVASRVPAQSRYGREVLAFYYGWYGSPEYSGQWRHWRRPGLIGMKQDPSLHTPTLGAYDSHDPVTLRKHAAMARSAGITALVATWHGPDGFDDRGLGPLLDAAHAEGIKVAPYIEASATSPQDALRFLSARYRKHPGLLKVEGRPVSFIYTDALNRYPAVQWSAAATAVESLGQPRPFLVGDISFRNPAQIAERLPQVDGTHTYVLAAMLQGMSTAEMRIWAATYYPRARRLSEGRLYCATVMPGFDDRLLGRPQPRPVFDRHGGETFQILWEGAIAAQPDWIIVTSFNEWHEGSEIEPSEEYGDSYLRICAEYSQKFL